MSSVSTASVATQPSATPSQSLTQQPLARTTSGNDSHIIDRAVIGYISITDKAAAYSEAPKTSKLISLVAKKVPTKWYEIGSLLDIETSTLDAFDTKTNDQVRIWIKVFDQWKREQKVPFTWETIINTLEEAEENSTAAGIREWLDTN